MAYLRIRTISIDVIPVGEPFISIHVEKVITDDLGKEIQVIGGFDRIYRRLSDIYKQPVNDYAADGMIDGMELYAMIATVALKWVAIEHDATLDSNGRLHV